MSVPVTDPHRMVLNKLKRYLIIFFSIITVAISILATVLTFNRTNDLLKEKVSALTLELTSQMRLNVENYFNSIETTSTLIFATKEVYTYDAEHTTLDEYDALATEKLISDTLYSLCIMNNYVDFGIVYSNNHTVGKISNGTSKLFGDGIYEELSAVVSRERTADGWATGCHDNYKRIYYVKRVNENAVFVASVYTTELANVFKHPTNIGDITVRLTDENFINMYSSEAEEIGQPIPEYISKRISNYTSASVLDNDYLVTINSCANNWFVICSIPTSDILKERNELMMYVIIVVIVTSALGIIAISLASRLITNPMSTFVNRLNTKAQTDQLTGILNKISFEEIAKQKLDNILAIDRYAMLLMDVDNFKGINDTLGHANGDKVLADIGKLLKDNFREDDCVGRLGGDEFGVLIKLPNRADNTDTENTDFDMGAYIDFITKKCTTLCDYFHDNYMGDNHDYKISISIGISLYPLHGKNFAQIYESADKALYISKNSGKDTFTFYDEKKEEQ